jgi:signal transduction histidine kinase
MGRDEVKGAVSWRLGLRHRVLVLVFLIPCSILVVGLPLLFVSQHRRAEREFRDRLRSEAGVLALALADSCERDCLHEVEPPVNLLLANEPAILSIEVFDRATGQPLAGWGKTAAALDPATYQLAEGEIVLEEEGEAPDALHASGHVFAAVTPLKTRHWKGSERPLLRIRGTSRAYNQRVVHMLLLALIPGGLAGAGGLLLAFWLNRRLRTAVSSIQEATRRIARGEFDDRVRVPTGDELEELGEDVNRMAEALAQQRDRLDKNAEVLEERLAARSLELEKARAIAVNQERVAAMGVLAAGVAHEIGNPLTAVSTVVQGLRRRSEVPDEKVDVLAENLERIQQILRSLVDYARPPANDWRPVSLNQLLRRTLDLVRIDPRAKEVDVSADLDPELPRVESLEDKLQQIFLNLLLNALDALGEGAGRVWVKTIPGEDEVRVHVEDSGPGVPHELREKIFEAFFTTRVERGGTGLGLAVSASLAEELGGRLGVEDSDMGGARFVLRLPTKRAVGGEA